MPLLEVCPNFSYLDAPMATYPPPPPPPPILGPSPAPNPQLRNRKNIRWNSVWIFKTISTPICSSNISFCTNYTLAGNSVDLLTRLCQIQLFSRSKLPDYLDYDMNVSLSIRNCQHKITMILVIYRFGGLVYPREWSLFTDIYKFRVLSGFIDVNAYFI